MKRILNNKILIILLIFLLLITTYSSVFALSQSEVEIIDFEQKYYDALNELEEYNSGNYWYSLRFMNNSCYVLFISKNDYPDLKAYISNEMDKYGNFRFYFNTNNSEVYGIFYKYNDSTGLFVNQNIAGHGYFDFGVQNNCIYLGTNISVYTDNTYSKVFFQLPPVTTLEEIIVQELDKKATIQEILGILPMILSVLVSLIALRKALRILVNFLRRS